MSSPFLVGVSYLSPLLASVLVVHVLMNQRVGGLITSFSGSHVKVPLGKTLNLKLRLMVQANTLHSGSF